MSDFQGLSVGDGFDEDDEVSFFRGTFYLGRSDVRALRDHLTALLGDAPSAQAGIPAAQLITAVKAAQRDVGDYAYGEYGDRAFAYHVAEQTLGFLAKRLEGK